MDRDQKFLAIKKAYAGYYAELNKQGKIPVRDTAVGIWGIAASDNVYRFFKEIHLEGFKSFLDLGSGDGSVVLIASLFTHATGIEFDEELVQVSNRMTKECGVQANFIQGDFLKHDWTKHDFVFINPDKGFHKGTEDKLMKELNGTLAVYNFVFQPRFLSQGRKYWYDQTPVTLYTRD